jgi:hypothetical protein
MTEGMANPQGFCVRRHKTLHRRSKKDSIRADALTRTILSQRLFCVPNQADP